MINASKASSVTSKVYGSRLSVSTTGMNSRFYVVSHDNFGFPRSSGGDLFSVTITGSHENSTTSFIQDYRNGSYLVGYLATVSGTYLINVFLDGSTVVASNILNVMPSFPSARFSRLALAEAT